MRRTLVVLTMLLAACSPTDDATETAPPVEMVTTTTMATTTTTEHVDMAVTTPAFAAGGTIPVEYTCDGDDVSPQLDIVGLPPATRAVAVIVTDPDAPMGTWYHWVEVDIPVDANALTLPRDVSEPGTPILNSWNLEGYMGPCPPAGQEHEYVFTVYALSSDLDLPSGVDAAAALTAVETVALDSAALSGVYAR